jgi:hypothetical protein
MPKKRPKLVVLDKRVIEVRRIIDRQRALLERLRITGQPTTDAEGLLRTYVSSLTHLLDHARRMRQDAQAKKGETKKTPAGIIQLNGAAFGRRDPPPR